jgi:hypothetical protein
MAAKKSAKNSAKKSLLKKMLNKKGASPFKMDNGLGKTPLGTPGSGNGSNLGTNGIF